MQSSFSNQTSQAMKHNRNQFTYKWPCRARPDGCLADLHHFSETSSMKSRRHFLFSAGHVDDDEETDKTMEPSTSGSRKAKLASTSRSTFGYVCACHDVRQRTSSGLPQKVIFRKKSLDGQSVDFQHEGRSCELPETFRNATVQGGELVYMFNEIVGFTAFA